MDHYEEQKKNLVTSIQRWIDGKEDENTSAIVGERGVGKTGFAKEVISVIGEEDAAYVSVKNRLTQKEEVSEFLLTIHRETVESKKYLFRSSAEFMFLAR